MSPNPATILLASANSDTVESLAHALRADGHSAIVNTTTSAAVETLALSEPDLAIVWLELPDTHGGFAMIRTIRDAVGSRIDPLTPLIAIDPSPGEFNCLCAFHHGCDDYVAGDCSTPQLRARIGALLRRSSGHIEKAGIDIGDLKIDSYAHQARVGEVELASHGRSSPCFENSPCRRTTSSRRQNSCSSSGAIRHCSTPARLTRTPAASGGNSNRPARQRPYKTCGASATASLRQRHGHRPRRRGRLPRHPHAQGVHTYSRTVSPTLFRVVEPGSASRARELRLHFPT